jgi:hypothetical protein
VVIATYLAFLFVVSASINSPPVAVPCKLIQWVSIVAIWLEEATIPPQRDITTITKMLIQVTFFFLMVGVLSLF